MFAGQDRSNTMDIDILPGQHGKKKELSFLCIYFMSSNMIDILSTLIYLIISANFRGKHYPTYNEEIERQRNLVIFQMLYTIE